MTKKEVINRGKRSKTLNEVKQVENISENLQSFLEISPVQKEDPPSHKQQDHAFFFFFFFFFFNYYLAAPRPTSGHYRGDSLTHPMLITAFVHVRPEGHREPRSEVGSLGPAERLARFESGTFRFL